MNASRTDGSELIINFTPTGMVPQKDQVPDVPVSPAEIIEQTHQAYELGITLVHLHARNNDGQPTHRLAVFEQIVAGIRRHCPDLVLCTSLSGRGGLTLEQRSEVLALRPDMASLTLSSLNFPRQASINSPETIQGLLNTMTTWGVTPELECFDPGMLNYSHYLLKKGLLTGPCYYNLLLGNIAGTQLDMAYIGLMLKDLPPGSWWALAGIGADQLRANTLAIACGGGVRVGLEDNVWADRRQTRTATNIELLQRVHQLATIFERPPMTPRQFGAQGFYNHQARDLPAIL